MAVPTNFNLNDVLLQLASHFAENNKLPTLRNTIATTITMFDQTAPGITEGAIFDLSNYNMTCFHFIYEGQFAGTTICGIQVAESAGATGNWNLLVQPTVPISAASTERRRARSNQNSLNGFARVFVDKAGNTGSILVVAHCA